jgi:hypothetical protein
MIILNKNHGYSHYAEFRKRTGRGVGASSTWSTEWRIPHVTVGWSEPVMSPAVVGAEGIGN